jgi:NhaP-type Na+/H+ or K+/H+ antiporter
MIFGVVLVWPVIHDLNWAIVIYGVLSLTLIRMIPVAISLIGGGFQRETFLFLGWFGPRGVASILFGLLVLGRANIDGREEIFTIIIATVLMSVFAHGLSAWPASKWYAARAEEMKEEPEMEELVPVTEMPVRIPYRE